jgi:hypothetical protein
MFQSIELLGLFGDDEVNVGDLENLYVILMGTVHEKSRISLL